MAASIPEPGSPGFTFALVRALAGHPSLRDWEPDPTILAVILLALIVRRGGIIFDVVPNGDAGDNSTRTGSIAAGIARISRVAIAIVQSVFGLDTSVLQLGRHSVVRDITEQFTCNALVVTGLENAPSPVQVKLREVLARAERQKTATLPLVVWVRDEGRSDDSPPWLIDIFSCSSVIDIDSVEPPPVGLEPVSAPALAPVPPEYVVDLSALLAFTHIHPPLQAHMSNLIASLALHPALVATLTARASNDFEALVRAHRLLASPFTLPEGWRPALRQWQRAECDSYGGGEGGERFDITGDGGSTSVAGYLGGRGGVLTWARRAGEQPVASILGPGAENWYCLPKNVAGAWSTAMRHRLRARGRGEVSLWALDGTARDRTTALRTGRGSRQRLLLDDSLDELLTVV